MSDILDDAQAWLDSIPEPIRSHWTECHTNRHHATCLVRKLLAEAERMRTERFRLTAEEREAIETADAYMSAAGCRNTNAQDTLRGLLERLGESNVLRDR